MKNLNIKAFIYILVGLSAILWFGLTLLNDQDLSSFQNVLKMLPRVVFIDLVVYGLFAKWGWRWRVFREWLVPFPDLNGTWKGHISSTWIGEKADGKPHRIPAVLLVKQSFLNISCVLRTEEMTSHSYAEGFTLDPSRQIRRLVYSYTSKPRPLVGDRSKAHDGTVVFEIVGTPASKLEGRYWTDRETTGEVTLTFGEKKHEVPDDLGPHPVSGDDD